MSLLTFTDMDGREITLSGPLAVSELSRADLSQPIKLDGEPVQVVRIADGVVGVAWSERAPRPPPIEGRLLAKSFCTLSGTPTLPEIVLHGVGFHRPSAPPPSARWEGPAPRRARRARR